MAFIQYLKFNDENIPFPDSYDVEMKDVESDASGETEAGTTQRDIVRAGVYSIPVSFSVSPTWLKKFTQYKQMRSITVDFFDPYSLETKQTEMYMDGYKASLVKDTSYKGLWKVSFTLKEL